MHEAICAKLLPTHLLLCALQLPHHFHGVRARTWEGARARYCPGLLPGQGMGSPAKADVVVVSSCRTCMRKQNDSAPIPIWAMIFWFGMHVWSRLRHAANSGSWHTRRSPSLCRKAPPCGARHLSKHTPPTTHRLVAVASRRRDLQVGAETSATATGSSCERREKPEAAVQSGAP